MSGTAKSPAFLRARALIDAAGTDDHESIYQTFLSLRDDPSAADETLIMCANIAVGYRDALRDVKKRLSNFGDLL